MSGADGHDGLQARLEARLVALCAIPSPTFHERRVADVLRDDLEALGLTVQEDGAGRALGGDTGNLICELPGGRPARIALMAHMDTVPPVPEVPLAPRVDGDRVHTGGEQILGADDKAGVAIAVELMSRLVEVPFERRPTVLAVFTVAEERGLLGARQLDVAALAADFAYVLDGEVPVGEVIATAPFKEALEIVVTGRRAHAALEPEQGTNAIAAAARVVDVFPLGRSTDTFVANLGRIEGGTATNVVPDEVRLDGEMRSFSEEELDAMFARFRDAARAAVAELGARIEIRRRRLYEGYDVPLDAPSLRRLRHAEPELEGAAFAKVRSIGGSDTNILVGKGLEAVDVGIGMHEIHSKDEWILTSDLARVTAWLTAALLVEDRHAPGTPSTNGRRQSR